MKTFLLLLFSILCSGVSQAQINWLETGQKWKLCSAIGWTFEIECQTLTVEGDTVIGGKACKKMGTYYAYEISDKIFVSVDGSTFQKVYDFDMIEGETLDAGAFTYQVDSLLVADLGDFSGVRIQKAHMVGGPVFGISTFYIAEGIGIIKNLHQEGGECICGHFFPHLLTCDFYIDGKDTYLSTFRQDNKEFSPADSTYCLWESAAHVPASLYYVRIEPNPVLTSCRLSYSLPFSDGDLALFNCTGIAVRQWKGLPDVLDLTTCQPGLYFLTIRRDGRIIWSGKIIKL